MGWGEKDREGLGRVEWERERGRERELVGERERVECERVG